MQRGSSTWLLYCKLFLPKCLYILCLIIFLYSFVTLFEISTQLGDEILSNSSHILPICDEALVEAQRILLEMQSANTKHKYAIKLNIHARMTGR